MSRFFCLDRETDAVLYRAESLPQARGFCEGSEVPARIACNLETSHAVTWLYQLCVCDEESGQIIAHGPLVDLLDAAQLMCSLRLILLPVESEVSA